MKLMMMLIAMAILLVAGCDYESPLTEEHNNPIDPAIIGLWESSNPNSSEMLILKYSDTEYLVYFDEAYSRAYPIEIGGVSCVQSQVIGDTKGRLPPDDDKNFNVVAYQLKDDLLDIKSLNTDLVSGKIKTTAELRETFLKHRFNKDLFVDWDDEKYSKKVVDKM